MEELVKGLVLALTRLRILLRLTSKAAQSGVQTVNGYALALIDGVADDTGAAIK